MSRSDAVLDDAVGQSLRGHHAGLARRVGHAATYDPQVATFAAVPAEPAGSDWSDLARLLGPGALADLFSADVAAPEGWTPLFHVDGVQMTLRPGCRVPEEDGRVVLLGADDVPEMLRLADLTRPGPFWPRTIELGTYTGIWEDGVLVAMAGERLHPPGWTEISAVCTAPQAVGRGCAAALVRAGTRRILRRGEQPFLHVRADNARARALYERLGFEVRRHVRFHGYRTPGADPAGSRPAGS